MLPKPDSNVWHGSKSATGEVTPRQIPLRSCVETCMGSKNSLARDFSYMQHISEEETTQNVILAVVNQTKDHWPEC